MRDWVSKVGLVALAGVLALGLGVVFGSASTPTPAAAPTSGSSVQSEWTLVVDGLVQSPLSLAFDDLLAMPTSTVYAKLYCVDLPSTPLAEGNWTGVRLGPILEEAGVSPLAVKVAFYADDGFTTDLTVTTAMRDDIILAYARDGEPLSENVRLVVPCKWGYKWISGPTHIELVDYDFLGTYESFGLSDEADIPGDSDGDGRGDACDDDDDNDAFSDDKELYIGTDPLDACPDGPTDDAWPLDVSKNGQISVVADVLNFRGRIGATAGSPEWWQRLDLNGDGTITVTGDVLLYRGKIGQTCS
jgi:hypothetical protein